MAYDRLFCSVTHKLTNNVSLQKDEEYSRDETAEGHKVIPLQCLALEEDDGEDRENGNRNHLLNNFELHQCEGSAIANESHAVCRHLTGILEERQEPTDKDDDVEWRAV